MFKLLIPSAEYFDERNGEFIYVDETILRLEHSLKAVAEWESKWNRSFINKGPANAAETISYIDCMNLDEDVDPRVYWGINDSMIVAVNEYIARPMTATTFSTTQRGASSRQIITAELLYHQMIIHGVPFECENWHLNRLITLLRVCAIKSAKPQKVSKKDAAVNYRQMNALRKQQLNTRG